MYVVKPGSTVMPDYKKNQNSEYRFMGPVPTVAGEKRDKYPSHETYLTPRQGVHCTVYAVQFQQRAANNLNEFLRKAIYINCSNCEVGEDIEI